MNPSLRRITVLVATTILALSLLPMAAFATLDDLPTPIAISKTNPNPAMDDGSYPDAWWRQGWGNSLHPILQWQPPSGFSQAVEGQLLGQRYQVTRDAVGPIDTSTPWLYSLGVFANTTPSGPFGTNMDQTYDLFGIYTAGLGSWPAPELGVTDPIEGTWWVHAKYFTNLRYSNTTLDVPLKIDITPPNPVTNLVAATKIGGSQVTTWVPQTRAELSWDPADYDALSGVGYYKVLLDDVALDPTTQGRVYELPWDVNTSNWAVENMPPGKHKLSIVCVDRATNESAQTDTYFYSDPDTPTVEFTSPLGGYINARSLVSVDASDKAGDPVVTFAFDGVTTATVSAPPYQFRPSLKGVPGGLHTITATVTDHLGRSVTATKTVSTIAATVSGFQPDDTGLMDDVVTGSSETNPNTGTEAWRQGWGNDMYPQFTFTPPAVDTSISGNPAGILYCVDKSPDTVIDISNPSAYYRSAHAGGTEMAETVDLAGIIAYPPLAGWPPVAPNEASVAEGRWYLHFVWFTDTGYAGTVTHNVDFGIDVTKPRALLNVQSSPTTDTADGGVWTTASRAHVTWTGQAYDDLSGVSYYQYLIDGDEPSGPSGGKVVEVDGRTPSAFTIEDMPAGKHKISVFAVDRAANEGPVASTYFYSDPDTPTISFGSFNRTVQVHPNLTVNVNDLAGISQVVYRVDGTVVGNSTSSPYSLVPDLGGFSSGAHTLTATAYDMVGRTAVASTNITLDKTPLSLTSFSRSPQTFYPIKRDGYYDNSTISFRINKSATVTLTIRNSKGTTVRTIKKSFSAGSNKFVWDGKQNDGKAHTGTFTYQAKGVDSAGYTSTSGKLTTYIKDYQIVVSGNTARIIPR